MATDTNIMLILFVAVCVGLGVLSVIFGGENPVKNFLALFDEDSEDGDEKPVYQRVGRAKTSESVVEMAVLVQKHDDRLRTIKNDGSEEFTDEYFELVFVTSKNKKRTIKCSKEVYYIIPFNRQGSLTYRKNTLVKFKCSDGTYYNSPEVKTESDRR